MSHSIEAAMKATAATGIGALLMWVPGVNLVFYIPLMLVLWTLSNIGVPGLGSPLHGFFIPSALGWSLVAITFWWASYSFLVSRYRRAASAARSAS